MKETITSSYLAHCKSYGIFNKYTTMAAFEAEAEVICLLLRLDSVMFLVSWPQCIYSQ